MPILSSTAISRQSPQFAPPVPRAPAPEPEPSWLTGVGAAIRRESLTYSMVTDLARQQAVDAAGGVDPDYNPYEDMAGYEDYAESLGDAVNTTDMLVRKRQIDRLQQADRDLAAIGGVEAFFSTGIAAITDLVMLPAYALGPTGAALRAGMVGRVAAQTAAAGAADAAIREVGLHAYQPDRDFSDSVLNVSASALFSGVIGGAIGKYYARSARRAADDPDVTPPSEVMTKAEVDRTIAYLEQDLAGNVTVDVPSGAVVGSTEASMASTLKAMKASLQRRVGDDLAGAMNQGAVLRGYRRELLDKIYEARVRLDALKEEAAKTRTNVGRAIIEEQMDKLRAGVEANRRSFDSLVEQVNNSQKSALFDLMNIQEWEGKYSPGEIVRAIEQKTTPDRVLVPEPLMPDRKAAQLTAAYEAADDLPSSAGRGSVGAAEVLPENVVPYEAAIDSLELVGTNAVARTISRATPIMRLLVHSNGAVADRAMAMFETTMQMRNSAGELVVTPISAERNAKRWIGKAQLALRETKRLHRQYRKKGGELPYGEFKNEIAFALRRGDVHTIPEVQQSAQLLRREVYDPLLEEGLRERVFDDLLRETYRTALDDMRKRLKLSLTPDEYKALPDAVLKPTNEDLDSMVGALASARNADDVTEVLESLFYGSDLLDTLRDRGELLRFAKQIEETIASPQGAASYVSRVYDRNKVIARRNELHQRLYDYFAQQQGVTPDSAVDVSNLNGEVEDAINSILGSPSGMTHAYSHGLTTPTAAQIRVLNVPDSLIEDFLVNDIEQLVTAYARDIGIRIELSKASLDRGNPNAWRLTADYEAMERAYQEELAALPDGDPQRAKLDALRDNRLRDFRAGHEQLLGLYGLPDSPHSFIAQVPFLARSGIALSAMGQVAVTSVPDLAKPVFNFGLRNVIKGLTSAPFIKELRNMTIEDLQAGGAAMELVGSMRAKSMADVEFANNANRVARTVNRVNEAFFTATGLNHWNTALESLNAFLGGDAILRTAVKLNDGASLSPAESSMLRRYGIDDAMAKRIAKQPFNRDHRLWAGGAKEWPDREAANAYTGALASLAHEALAQPGVLDVPLLYRGGEWQRLLGSLQTFAFSQVAKFVVPLITRQAVHSQVRTFEGILAIMSLGAASLYIKALVADKQSEVTGKPNPYAKRVLRSFERAAKGDNDAVSFVIAEALDRSGLLGPISTWAGMAEAVGGPSVSLPNLVSLATTGEPNRELLRKRTYQQGASAFLGPSANLFANMAGAVQGTIEGDAERVATSVRSTLAFNNLIGISALFDLAEEAAKEASR